jgi:hypothetical protein
MLHDRFVVTRRRRYTLTPSLSSVDVYEFSLPTTDEPFCRVRQRVSRFNEDIRFYADEAGLVELMRIRALRRFDPWARYEVLDPSGETIGEIEKIFGTSPLRSTYVLYGREGEEVARVVGRPPVARTRRLAGRLGVVGLAGLLGLGGITLSGPAGVAGLATFAAAMAGREARARLDPVDAVTDFDITRDGEPLGTHRRRPRPPGLGDMVSMNTTIFDVDMSPDRGRTVDRRLILALTVALDALRGLLVESPLR